MASLISNPMPVSDGDKRMNIDLLNIGSVCFDCAKKAGFKMAKTAVGVWTDECGICHQQKPCTNLWHDWVPPKEARCAMKKITNEIDSKKHEPAAASNQPNKVETDLSNLIRLNAAKMREALEKADKALSLISKSAWFMEANFHETKEVMEAGEAIVEAFSAPARNCDVYTTVDELRNALRLDRCCLCDPLKERNSVLNFVLAEAADVKLNLTTAEAKGGEKNG